MTEDNIHNDPLTMGLRGRGLPKKATTSYLGAEARATAKWSNSGGELRLGGAPAQEVVGWWQRAAWERRRRRELARNKHDRGRLRGPVGRGEAQSATHHAIYYQLLAIQPNMGPRTRITSPTEMKANPIVKAGSLCRWHDVWIIKNESNI